MEAKKSKKAAIENQRGSWLLMGLVVALAFMFVSFEWTQHDVRVAAVSSDDESIFVTELVPITFPEEKLENDKNHSVEHIRCMSYTEKHIRWKRDL